MRQVRPVPADEEEFRLGDGLERFVACLLLHAAQRSSLVASEQPPQKYNSRWILADTPRYAQPMDAASLHGAPVAATRLDCFGRRTDCGCVVAYVSLLRFQMRFSVGNGTGAVSFAVSFFFFFFCNTMNHTRHHAGCNAQYPATGFRLLRRVLAAVLLAATRSTYEQGVR